MTTMALSKALEREHRDIDGGIEEYSTGLSHGETDCRSLLRAMEGLRRHIYLEEEILFPQLKASGLGMPIFVMVREHGELWDAMTALDTLLESDATAQTLQNACRELLAKLDNHNSKEEPIIYSLADVELEPGVSSKLQEFIDSGAMPENWVCEKAA